ncbi:hypothetical protein MRB53_038429 [Persea americana]|nr:hypothetical protein MRB53_038429 [Persea americana]
MRLSDVAIRRTGRSLDQFSPPMTREELARLGMDGYAVDYLRGPAAVLAMLCENIKIHATAVMKQDMSEQQYSALESSVISSWVTSASSYQVTRRREYGPSAVSTRVRDVLPARYWTSQGVDSGAVADLRDNISGWRPSSRPS